ncbi:MAG: DUF2157 domain-containing protein [Alphaproteobacteria bacterium]|jgi:uncharacterized membrane protein|nr:DUF2157 domain-containing protein [Alphaproteobacteria bacterium]
MPVAEPEVHLMMSSRGQIIDFIEQGAIPSDRIADALTAAKAVPDGKAWRAFIDHLLLWLGGLALACAIVFVVAFNWNEIGRFAKFGVVQLALVLAVAAYCKLGAQGVAGKVSLLVATILLGVLLALYGQTHQTGADPWQLSFVWALLMLPWALVGRFAAIWIVWLTLINLSIGLYHQTFQGVLPLMLDTDTSLLWLIFLVNTLALFAWEFLAARWHWLWQRWAVRLLAVASGAPITMLVLESIFSGGGVNVFPGVAWVIGLAALYFVYRGLRRDLFMLAGGCLSGIVVLTAFLGEQMAIWEHSVLFLLLSLLVIALASGAAVWLRNIHREWQS